VADEDNELSPWLVFVQRLEEDVFAILVFDWKLADLLERLRIWELVLLLAVLALDGMPVLRWCGGFCRFSLFICRLHDMIMEAAEVDEG
jgi:hypothetical protein